MRTPVYSFFSCFLAGGAREEAREEGGEVAALVLAIQSCLDGDKPTSRARDSTSARKPVETKQTQKRQ